MTEIDPSESSTSLVTDANKSSLRNARVVFIVAVIIIYTAILWFMLQLPEAGQKDELHFWPTSLRFSEQFPPSIGLLRSYPELSTPLPFVIYGFLEHTFHGGINVGRSLNVVLSLIITLIIGWPRRDQPWRHVLACIGMFCCAYYPGISFHLYTDMPACFFTLLGFLSYCRKHHIISALCFILAISCRQYMVAFPAAIFLHELLRSWRGRSPRLRMSWITQFVAAGSLLGWILFFGGPAPANELTRQNLDQTHFLHLSVDHSLYTLACLGVYFVIAEKILFFRTSLHLRGIPIWHWLVCLVLLFTLFVFFPPLGNEPPYAIVRMGHLDRLLQIGDYLNVPIRMGIFFILALLVCLRFRRFDLVGWLIIFNVALMMKAHIAWDKYMLPLLIVLWYLKSVGRLDPHTRTEAASGKS